MPDANHVLVIGATQSGKTYWSNELHQSFPGKLSVFINTNHANVWGAVARSHGEFVRLVAQRETHINLMMPADRDAAEALLRQVQETLFKWGKNPRGIWCQIIVDEAQVFSREGARAIDPVQVIATRGLGAYGIRLVAITQYPVALNTTTRTNLRDLVIFDPGREGLMFLRSKGFKDDADRIEEHTRQQYHFVTVRGSSPPEYRAPVA